MKLLLVVLTVLALSAAVVCSVLPQPGTVWDKSDFNFFKGLTGLNGLSTFNATLIEGKYSKSMIQVAVFTQCVFCVVF